MTPQDNKAAVTSFFELMNAGDIANMVSAYAPDGHVHTMGTTLISGVFDRGQVRIAADRIYDVFPKGIRFVVHCMTAEDDRVAVEAESFGEHISGKAYHNHYHFLFQLRDGKIVQLKEYCDTEHITEVICGGARPPAPTVT